MLSGYSLTEFEANIEKLYQERKILSPSDLDIYNVAKAFHVKIDTSLKEGPQRAIWDENTTVIFLNQDLPEEKQRAVFYHELCHPLMHCGDQSRMDNKSFLELQETQANQFQLYAAIPFFMLKQLDLPAYEYQIINLIKNVFKVPTKLAMKRLEQIKRRIIQNKMDDSFYSTEIAEPTMPYGINEYFPQLEDLFTENEIKTVFIPKVKKKINLFYDIYEGKLIPIWYCIDIDRGEINWSEKFHLFPIDVEYQLIPIREFQEMEYDAPGFEILLDPSHPNDFAVDLKSLKKQLLYFDIDPYNIRRIVIDPYLLEQTLQLDLFSKSINVVSENVLSSN